MKSAETSSPTPLTAPAIAPAPSLVALFAVCLKIGCFSFGGGLSGWLHREFVLRHRWIDDAEFASALAVAQVLPGANVVNLVIAMGDQLRGATGAAVSVLGFLIGPFFAVIGLYTIYDRIAESPTLTALTEGVTFAALGLLAVICVRGVQRLRKWRPGLLVVAVTAVAVGILRLPLIPVVLTLAPVSIWLASRRPPRSPDA